MHVCISSFVTHPPWHQQPRCVHFRIVNYFGETEALSFVFGGNARLLLSSTG